MCTVLYTILYLQFIIIKLLDLFEMKLFESLYSFFMVIKNIFYNVTQKFFYVF